MIKNKLKKYLAISIIFSFGLVSGNLINAANLTYSVATTIDLTTSDFTISAGSTAGGLVVNADDVVVTMGVGDSFTVTNSTRGLEVSGSNAGVVVSNTCSGGVGIVTITSSTGTGDYTISSSALQCPTTSGGLTPPTSTSVVIAGGESVTTTSNVSLALGAIGANYMAISNSSDFSAVSWEDYATSKEWTLTEGNGIKTVYVKFKNTAGSISSVVSDSITLSVTEEVTEEEETTEEEDAATIEETASTTAYDQVSDGDIIQCKGSSNPFAVYIVKTVGDVKHIRHIVSLEIFNYYGHLKWENLKQVDSLVDYSLSGWVRYNTGENGTAGPNDKVYEINGDQTKHWINMTAEQFLSHGGSESAIYSVNQGELDLYTTGPDVIIL